ncbi:MAG: hypothetical protein ACI4EY_02995 [Lachnospiraceae bacterium]
MVATLEDSVSDQQLLLLQRMIMADADRKRIDYYMGNLGKIQPDNVIFRLDNEVIAAHANQLLLDMIVIVKLGKNCTIKTYGVIADIASILGKTKSEFIEICMVAISVITQECNRLPEDALDVIRLDKEYGFYLEKLATWQCRVEHAIEQMKCLRRINSDEDKADNMNLFGSGELLGYGIHLI